ncbi:MAG: transketolase C-terminal domain-containing protein [Actinomycetota bacterium]
MAAKMRLREAVRRALHDEMAADPSVILLGEDLAAAGGAFKVTEGLLDAYGEKRVKDTPISEEAFLGAAVGAAATGLRPVVEMMFVEFIGVGLDQLTTQAAKLRYLSRGTATAPLVVRATAGAGLGFGCQHSQILDGWFRGVPGLKLVIPSDAQAAYGLLRAAIRDDDPVVFLEHKALYASRSEVVTGEEGVLELGKARTMQTGTDVTVVTSGLTVGIAMKAAGMDESPSMEVIDLQTLAPWDRDAVLESVARTGRIATVEEGPFSAGWGTEIVSEVAVAMHGKLAAPPLRITSPDVPVPYAGALEARYVPTPALVAGQLAEFVSTGESVPAWWTKEVPA